MTYACKSLRTQNRAEPPIPLLLEYPCLHNQRLRVFGKLLVRPFPRRRSIWCCGAFDGRRQLRTPSEKTPPLQQNALTIQHKLDGVLRCRALLAPRTPSRATRELARKIIKIFEAGVVPADRTTPKPPAPAVDEFTIGVSMHWTAGGSLRVVTIMWLAMRAICPRHRSSDR